MKQLKQGLDAEKARARTKAWAAANRERKRAADADHYAKNKDKLSEYGKRHYLENKEKYADRSRNYYEQNKEAAKARATLWRKANKEKGYAAVRARRLKKRDSLKAHLLKVQKGKCVYCNDRLVAGKFHIDHIMPRKLGGSEERSNFQLTCSHCNHTKAAKHPIDFAQSIGRLL